jgi:hypothetical protein
MAAGLFRTVAQWCRQYLYCNSGTVKGYSRKGSWTRLRALFLKALAALQKPSIVDYAGLLRLARTIKNSTLKRVAHAPKR